jgi:hypothetical protein
MLNFLREIFKSKPQSSESEIKKFFKKFKEDNRRSILEHLKIFFNLKRPDALYPGNFFWSLREAIRYKLTGWERSLLWCPSQLYKTYYYKTYQIELYARWRWEDPWTGHFIIYKNKNIILNNVLEKEISPEDINKALFLESLNEKSIWSEEILSRFDLSSADEISTIEKTMEDLYKYYFIDKKEKLRFGK